MATGLLLRPRPWGWLSCGGCGDFLWRAAAGLRPHGSGCWVSAGCGPRAVQATRADGPILGPLSGAEVRARSHFADRTLLPSPPRQSRPSQPELFRSPPPLHGSAGAVYVSARGWRWYVSGDASLFAEAAAAALRSAYSEHVAGPLKARCFFRLSRLTLLTSAHPSVS